MAVPSSGAISLTGLAGEKLNDDYDDQDFDDVISLTDLVLGGNTNGSHESWEATNANSTSKPDTSAPHAMSEWYGYDHDAAAAFANAKAVSKTISTGTGNSINFVDSDDTFNFTGTTAWTISFWVKAGWTVDLNTNIHFIIGQRVGAVSQLEDMVKIIYKEDNNRISVRYGNKDGVSWYNQGEWLFHSQLSQYVAGYNAAGLGSTFWNASNRGYVNSDNYTMITVTKSTTNTAASMKLYWNANAAGAAPLQTNNNSGNRSSIPMSATENRTWSVGSNGVSANEIKCGDGSATVYNDLTIWNKQLSDSEVTSLYNNGTVIDAATHSASSNLIGYWKWEGNGNATVSNDNFTISGGSSIVNK